MVEEIDIEQIAPGAMTREQASEKEHSWRVLIWGPPGVGKTHFSLTAPAPVCMIDTESKSHDITHKFDKPIYIWQPEDYDEAVDSLHEALEVLDRYRSEQGVTGTIVVDSMSVMWGWSQQKYVDKYYGGKDASEVTFSSGFGGGESDWKKIKSYHNKKFRSVMLNSPYHIVWTAMREKDYDAAMDGIDRDKPSGEKENTYKVAHIVHLDEDDTTGVPRAQLEKSGLIKHRFKGLEYPTFDKLFEVIEDIDHAESSDQKVKLSDVTDYDIEIVKGNPRYQMGTDDE